MKHIAPAMEDVFLSLIPREKSAMTRGGGGTHGFRAST
jgi:hypothetical protein